MCCANMDFNFTHVFLPRSDERTTTALGETICVDSNPKHFRPTSNTPKWNFYVLSQTQHFLYDKDTKGRPPEAVTTVPEVLAVVYVLALSPIPSRACLKVF